MASPSPKLTMANVGGILASWEQQADAVMAAELAVDQQDKKPMSRLRAFLRKHNPFQSRTPKNSASLLIAPRARRYIRTPPWPTYTSSTPSSPATPPFLSMFPAAPSPAFDSPASSSPAFHSPASTTSASSIPADFFSLPDAGGMPNFYGGSDSPPQAAGPSGPVPVQCDDNNTIGLGIFPMPTTTRIRRKPVPRRPSFPDPKTVPPSLLPAFGTRCPDWDSPLDSPRISKWDGRWDDASDQCPPLLGGFVSIA
ncbi:hypothetical protein BC567DRAFT_300135 [Phyllosticta citribraziliensis]